jgi:hypothetical protein
VINEPLLSNGRPLWLQYSGFQAVLTEPLPKNGGPTVKCVTERMCLGKHCLATVIFVTILNRDKIMKPDDISVLFRSVTSSCLVFPS